MANPRFRCHVVDCLSSSIQRGQPGSHGYRSQRLGGVHTRGTQDPCLRSRQLAISPSLLIESWLRVCPGVETLRDAGFQPTLQIEGNPTPIREPARDALVKASREAIENIRRHGDPAESCSIMVAATPSHLELVFVNVPRGDGSSAATKLGLIGMKERLEELGGTVETVRGARQWLTRLVLPLGAASRSRSAHA